MIGVRLERASGAVELVRPEGQVATLTQPGQPARRVSLARRATDDCLAEELRRLDPDDVLGDVLTKGLAMLTPGGRTDREEGDHRHQGGGADAQGGEREDAGQESRGPSKRAAATGKTGRAKTASTARKGTS